MHRTLCNLALFTTLVYSSLSILKTRGILWAVFYRTLCNTVIFETRGIFRILSNIYYQELYSEPRVTLVHLKPYHIENPRHIQITVKHISWNILLKALRNRDIFRALVYSQLWNILKSKNIQSPAEYLRWSICCFYRLKRELKNPWKWGWSCQHP